MIPKVGSGQGRMVEVKRRDFSGILALIAKNFRVMRRIESSGLETIERSPYTSRLVADVAQSVEQRIRNA
jgi:hypothetical protein